MAGIGDYIHYKAENYRKYGLERANDEGRNNYGGNLSKIFSEQTMRCKQMAKGNRETEDIKGLEDFLNSLYTNKDNYNDKNSKEAFEEFQDRVEKTFEEKYKGFSLELGDKTMKVHAPKLGLNLGQKNIRVDTLRNHLNTLDKMLKGEISLTGKADKNEIVKAKESLEKLLKENTKKSISIKDNKGILDQLDKALKLQAVPYKNAIGDAFEYWLAMANTMANNLAGKNANEIIDDFVKGTSRSNPSISLESNFSSDYVDFKELDLGKGWELTNNEAGKTEAVFNKPTQDKLDVIFKWEGKDLNISAKNYGFSRSNWVHLVSGTSLLYLLSAEKADFVNHWLNCVASIPQNDIDSTILQDAHRIMKLTIFAKALTGSTTSAKNHEADVFILNDRTAGHIYVRTTSAVFQAISTALNSKNDNKLEIKNYPMTIENDWVGDKKDLDPADAKTRITQLLSKIHTMKISASIDRSIIET